MPETDFMDAATLSLNVRQRLNEADYKHVRPAVLRTTEWIKEKYLDGAPDDTKQFRPILVSYQLAECVATAEAEETVAAAFDNLTMLIGSFLVPDGLERMKRMQTFMQYLSDCLDEEEERCE